MQPRLRHVPPTSLRSTTHSSRPLTSNSAGPHSGRACAYYYIVEFLVIHIKELLQVKECNFLDEEPLRYRRHEPWGSHKGTLDEFGRDEASSAISRMAAIKLSMVSRHSGFGRLNHKRLMKQQGKYMVGGMIAVVKRTFGDMQCRHPPDLSRNPSNTNSCLHTPSTGRRYKSRNDSFI